MMDIKPALEHFMEYGTHPTALFNAIPCAFFEHYLAQGRTPAEIYDIAFGKNAITCQPKPDRHQIIRTANM